MPGCGTISELPESLLTEILSYLPTKHSVTTSALSRRWKNLWLGVPALDLNCDDFLPYSYREDEAVLRFLDRFLEFNPDLRLLKVKVKYGSVGLKDRISTVIQRGPQHLDVEGLTYYKDMPLNLYTSRTLVSLTITYSGLEDPGLVYMPCLKSMTLVKPLFRDDECLERLVSGCPVLEELTLVRDTHSSYVGEVDSFVRVRSGSLKRFRVPLWYEEEYCTSRFAKYAIEIDAPRLEHMTLGEDQFDSIAVKNLDSLFRVDLDIKFGGFKLGEFFVPEDSSERKNFGHLFLSGILSVRHMIISEKTVEALHLYSDVGLIPKFISLTRLEAVFPCILSQFLPVFLECCPNLKHLILEVVGLRWTEEAFELTNVPECFLSTLECVELKRICYWKEAEIKVATYFLENAAVLKKLTLSLLNSPRYVSDEEIFEEVNKVTKRSPRCQILPDWDSC
ncbi:F-box/FBD/LRR-repeat protein [Raphanus sativus]|uniref:F-box/FBD/LRR-repeat protein At1g13780-like n=1 Tax=Raphanus sativus TaxID=3726 RepID=A0A9W3C3T1_RAPSA|nr:F-box/FBD/LRR-repeat protein At1g13780-like [Raphanus sativus]KAJ4915704.1 F-box/FBD/LRR-repeat protein [Raphanus sativus]